MPIRRVSGSQGPAQRGQRKALLHLRVFNDIALIVVVYERVREGSEINGEGESCKQNTEDDVNLSAPSGTLRLGNSNGSAAPGHFWHIPETARIRTHSRQRWLGVFGVGGHRGY